ncbi:protein disulfide-isomerase a6 [Anaeramoeba flamelloides]|uniref:Protein disulfide-isomerase a6 n=1 Tax=Anaeramoeba flamelloides TaxID=1746091 RepID=A0AAV7ZSL0_9EUKA|nr:protein disulfide-isomerase a6 [Anaeramoeba flamelloides]
MNKLLTVTLFFAILFCCFCQEETENNEVSDVVKLTKDNFDKKVSKGSWFIKFYSESCRHCQLMAEDFEYSATNLKNKINFGSVLATEEEELSRRFRVMSYPTLLFFYNGEEFQKFRGERTVDGMSNFVLKTEKRAEKQSKKNDDWDISEL